MRVLDELSTSHETTQTEREVFFEAERECHGIKAHLASACHQQDDVLKVNAEGGERGLVGNLDVPEDQFSFSSWTFDEDADEDILPAGRGCCPNFTLPAFVLPTD